MAVEGGVESGIESGVAGGVSDIAQTEIEQVAMGGVPAAGRRKLQGGGEQKDDDHDHDHSDGDDDEAGAAGDMEAPGMNATMMNGTMGNMTMTNGTTPEMANDTISDQENLGGAPASTADDTEEDTDYDVEEA